MRIIRATAKNFRGFTDFAQDFGDVNCITGRNAEGKSSVLDILCAAFVTDGDRDLLRVGAEEGEISVTLEDDDASKIEVRRTLKPGKLSPARITPNCGAVATFLKSIVDTVTLDPIRQVMTAPAKQQNQILLDTLPLEMDAAPIKAALAELDGLVRVRVPMPNGKANLDTITTAHAAIYAARRDINRDAKTKATHATELAKSVEGWAPPEGQTWAERLAALNGQIEDLIEADEQKRRAESEGHLVAVQNQQAEAVRLEREIDQEIDAKIRELERQRAQRKADIQIATASVIRDLDEQFRLALESIENGSLDERLTLIAERARAQQAAEQQARVEETCKIAEAAQVEAGKLQDQSERMTEALRKMDAAKQQLLENLPIKGLDVANGTATLDGVPLAELNTAAKAKFWIRVAVLRAVERKLKAVVLDDCEHFDDIQYPRLIEACKQSGLQFFISRVEPHDFQIEVM